MTMTRRLAACRMQQCTCERPATTPTCFWTPATTPLTPRSSSGLLANWSCWIASCQCCKPQVCSTLQASRQARRSCFEAYPGFACNNEAHAQNLMAGPEGLQCHNFNALRRCFQPTGLKLASLASTFSKKCWILYRALVKRQVYSISIHNVYLRSLRLCHLYAHCLCVCGRAPGVAVQPDDEGTGHGGGLPAHAPLQLPAP